jgi:hypothetical protein
MHSRLHLSRRVLLKEGLALDQTLGLLERPDISDAGCVLVGVPGKVLATEVGARKVIGAHGISDLAQK